MSYQGLLKDEMLGSKYTRRSVSSEMVIIVVHDLLSLSLNSEVITNSLTLLFCLMTVMI